MQFTTFQGLANFAVQIIGAATAILIVAAIAIYFSGIAFNLFEVEGKGKDHLRTILPWGLLALFVMLSVWGLIALLGNTLFG